MQTIQIITQDGTTITGSLFTPSQAPKAGIIINSATAVPRGFYRNFANYLAAKGYVVISYDYRGIGDSKNLPPKDPSQTMQAWGEQDFNSVINWATKNHPAFNWHCIGHSVGGQLIGLAKDNHKISSVYNVAAQSGNWRNWHWAKMPKLWLMWYVFTPFFTQVLGFLPGFLVGGQPLPKGIAQQWGQWCRNKDYICNDKGQSFRPYFSSFNNPMNFIQIKDDLDFAPLKAVQQLHGFYHQAPRTIEVLSPKDYGQKKIGHFGFFNKQNEQGLWQHALNWLESDLKVAD